MMCSNIVQNIWSYAWKTKQEGLKKKDDEECDTESTKYIRSTSGGEKIVACSRDD